PDILVPNQSLNNDDIFEVLRQVDDSARQVSTILNFAVVWEDVASKFRLMDQGDAVYPDTRRALQKLFSRSSPDDRKRQALRTYVKDVQTKFEQFCSNAETKLPNTFQVKEAEVENHINKYILPGTIVYKQK
uniref:Uncharacterized protein n=1 Tax=Panagrolaimus sp. JU765 TaxID=591449 RepID=A0AC34RTH4_9BILA